MNGSTFTQNDLGLKWVKKQLCGSGAEFFPPSGKQLRIWAEVGFSGDEQAFVVKALEAVEEHGAIGFAQHIGPDLHHIVRTDAEKKLVEGGMMEFAKGDAVFDDGISAGLVVWNDVGRIEQLAVPQPAQSALISVSGQHPLPESPLMKPMAHPISDIGAPCHDILASEAFADLSPFHRLQCVAHIVKRDLKRELFGHVTHDKHRPFSKVFPGDHAVEIDQRGLLLKCFSKPDIFMMPWIVSPVAIKQESIGSKAVVVWAFRGGGNAKRNFIEDSGLENALGTEEGNSLTAELEALGKNRPRDDIFILCRFFRQPVKCRQPHFGIDTGQKLFP